MSIVLVFGVMLLVSSLISGYTARAVLSTALLFLFAGAITGNGGLHWIDVSPDDPIVATLADLALFSVLYTDGMRAALPALRATGRHAGRALGLGMPLTFAGITLLTKAFTGLDWTASMLVGAILAPTDPVFAAAIVGRGDVPARLRRLLNVESGLNDGLALPVVVILIATASHGRTHIPTVLIELAGGVALGVAMPLAARLLARLPGAGSEAKLAPLSALALAVVLYATCHLTHANPYLAAFAAGSTLATVAPRQHEEFEEFGELIAELLKLAALLVFGALLTPALLHRVPIGAWAVAVLALVLVRPAALVLSLLGAKLSRLEVGAVAWFGPKGFASVVYGLLALDAGIPSSQPVFDLVAVCIALSIVAHSSSDVPIARMFTRSHPRDAVDAPELQ